MSEVYWLTRLGALNSAFVFCFALSLSVTLIAVIAYLINSIDSIDKDSKTAALKWLKYSVPMAFIFGMGVILTPTTTEAFAIYGIGGALEYVKSNDTAKQLPDKVVDALDKYLDSLADEQKK